MLCEECRDDLSSPIKVSPEQIQNRGTHSTDAALIDLWGRAHRLDPQASLGRQVEEKGIAILEPSVSRLHAELTLANGRWTVRDLKSANGTYADDRLVEDSAEVPDGTRLRLGHIAFYFIADSTQLPIPKPARTATSTIRPDTTKKEPAPAQFTDSGEFEHTNIGLPTMVFKLHEPTGGGGGLIEVNGKQVQLTTTQFELMALMIRRMATEAHQPELVRGFVRSSELIADLSWDTREPSENHVKQLVRRVRRALIKSEIGDLIESRHRFGYRLRAIPRTE